MVYFVHTAPNTDFFSISATSSWLVWTLLTFMVYFLVGELISTYFMATCARSTSYHFCTHYSISDLFCRYGTFWRLILYTYFSMFDLFSTSTRSCWPSLYTCDFYGLFVYFLLLGWLIFTHFITTCARNFVVLFCTHTFTMWFFLFIRKFFVSYSLWPILFFFYVFYLYIFYGFVHTYLQWPILHTCPFLVTYSAYKEPFGVLFCTQSSLCLIYFVSVTTLHGVFFYTCFFHGLFCLFTSPGWAYVYMNDIFWICVHVPLLIYLLHVPHLGDLFSTF